MPKTLETRKLIDTLFKKHMKGFYIYAKQRVTKAKKTARYIGRYIRHPAIAESRITSFNQEANTITFQYNRNGSIKAVTMPALEFIDKLVKLIPDKNFKLTRYYARRTGNKLQKILTPLTKDTPKPTTQKETITCPECGTPMQLISITRPN